MDTNMEDVGRVPADLPSTQNLEPTTIPTLDGWIESLMSCKQLVEADVQRLCEKVSLPSPAMMKVVMRVSHSVTAAVRHSASPPLISNHPSRVTPRNASLTSINRRGKSCRTNPMCSPSYVSPIAGQAIQADPPHSEMPGDSVR